MQKITASHIFMVTMTMGSLLCARESDNWPKREQAVQEFIRKELTNGTPLHDLRDKLRDEMGEKTPEHEAYMNERDNLLQQLKELNDTGCYDFFV